MDWFEEFLVGLSNRTTNDKKKMAAHLLNEIAASREFLGTPLFNAIARHHVGIALEGVILRRTDGQTEVYLTKREADEAYGGQWHCPGTFLRNGEDEKRGFDRLAMKELSSSVKSFRLCTERFVPEERYETMLERIYFLDLASEPLNKKGRWFKVEDVLDNKAGIDVVHFHLDIIRIVRDETLRLGLI